MNTDAAAVELELYIEYLELELELYIEYLELELEFYNSRIIQDLVHDC